MSYNVGALWIIYIIIVAIMFLLFWLLLGSIQKYYASMSYGFALLIATLIGAIAVFVGAAWLDPNQLNTNEKTWLSVLFVIAFLVPIFIILYIVWAGEYASITGEDDCLPSWCKSLCNPCDEDLCIKDEKTRIEKTIHCDTQTGQCQIKKKKFYKGDNVTTVIYS